MDTPLDIPAPPSGRRCAVCGRVNLPGRVSCRSCFSPLNEIGVFTGLERPPDPARRWVGGSVFAGAALAGMLWLFPDSPARALQARLFPPKPAPPVREVSVPLSRGSGLGKFEPPSGCFLGAFVLRDEHVDGRMDRWEEATGKGHASYLRYVGFGKPFPSAWVRQVRERGAVPNIAWEPNTGLIDVQEDDYIRGFARAAAESGGPVFLRFASEMNGGWTAYHGDPDRYRAKFRIIAEAMHRDAPNVAMVWTPYCTPLRAIPDYYPGDDVVDWVGVNLYSVHHHDGSRHRPAHREDPAELLRPIYEIYADRKPIQISEYAATHGCKACGREVVEFAVEKMTRMYRSLPDRFPRVKMIYWFSWDTISGKSAENNYAATDDPTVLSTYRRLIAPSYFLPRIPEGEYWLRLSEPASPNVSAR